MKTKLPLLFDAERTVRRVHAELLDGERGALLEALEGEARTALASGEDEDANTRLVRIAALLGDLEGPRVVDLLIDILAGESSEARAVAGEELEGIAFERFKEVALGIERALERLPASSLALQELPYLLAEVAEPGCVKLLGKFLLLADPEAVASAIEALAELGDPSAAHLLAPLERDKRQVDVDDEEGGARVTLGELAHEARELLSKVDACGGESRSGAKKR